ncbi:M13 family metallopeptidase [Caldiplasma sukawensis]
MKENEKNIGFSIENMDQSIDPFDDFYKYSCGNWLKKTQIPKDFPFINSFLELWEKNMEDLKQILEESLRDAGKTKEEEILGDFYRSFMNKNEIERKKFFPISGIMEKIHHLGNIEEASAICGELASIGVYSFFTPEVYPDAKKSNFYALSMVQGGLSLPERDYYMEERFSDLREKFKLHIKTMFEMYGFPEREAADKARMVYEIEEKIASISWPSQELRDEEKNYNKYSYEEVRNLLKPIDYNVYLKNLGVEGPEYVIIGQPDFFSKLSEILSKVSIEHIKAYLRWRVLVHFSPFLHEEAENENFNFFQREIYGTEQKMERWKFAAINLDRYIGDAIGKIYVKKHFSEESKKKMEELVSNLIMSFRETIENSAWMSQETKKRAMDKLSTLRVKIGYPEKFKDYSYLVIKSDDLVGNIIRAGQYETARMMKKVGMKVDREEWYMTPQTVNAYNNVRGNEIVFPAGILQPPFFDPQIDYPVNYGAIGTVIGHEITHGYDDQGRKYDGNGNLNSWWSESDEKKFNELSQKVVELYGSIEMLEGMKINGLLTAGEDIADLGGVSIAFRAMKRKMEKDGRPYQRKDGFTPEQRFFISASQIWKSKIMDNALRQRIKTDNHSPDSVRGLIPIITNPEFENTFSEKSKLKSYKNKMPYTGIW